jgi:hypothetical protein
MGQRKAQLASWELDSDKRKPVGETRVRRSFCTQELTLSEFESSGGQQPQRANLVFRSEEVARVEPHGRFKVFQACFFS